MPGIDLAALTFAPFAPITRPTWLGLTRSVRVGGGKCDAAAHRRVVRRGRRPRCERGGGVGRERRRGGLRRRVGISNSAGIIIGTRVGDRKHHCRG